MKETPLLMRGHLVVATLHDLKTQTRRTTGLDLVNTRPDNWRYHGENQPGGHIFFYSVDGNFSAPDLVEVINCPYGRPGDRLWVKEAHRLTNCTCEEACRIPGHVWYEADASGYDGVSLERLRPSIHMPRWASRLTLEITVIRVQRLQDISDRDADAEGTTCHYHCTEPTHLVDGIHRCHPIIDFRDAWDSINAKRNNGKLSWAKNPWVWALTYKRL